MSRHVRATLLPLLAFLLVLSGACALVYQVLWLRLLSLTFGVTTYAASTVLASFMAGLALGSLAAGKIADRSRYPLRLFGMAELLIGVCALVTPAALDLMRDLYLSVFTSLPDSMALATLVRFVLSFAVLLVPTALMGATLPIVLKSSTARTEGLGTRASLLYASNTSGAIVGAMLAGIYLIPALGISRSFLLAASVNGLVGLTALGLSWLAEPGTALTSASDDSEVPPPETASPRVTRVILGVFAVSGFASLALEVIWFRILVIFLGPTSYAFTVMLAAVLAGIALGSALMAPLMRLRLPWLPILAALQVAAALVALSSLRGLGAPPSLDWLIAVLGPGFSYLVPYVTTSVIAIMPTSILLGAAFPLGLRLFVSADSDERQLASRTGLFYSVNVVGGIAGSIVAGFLMLPWLGSRLSIIVLAGLFLASGIALLLVSTARRSVLLAAAAVVILVFTVRIGAVPDPLDLARRRVYGRPVLWQDEGVQTTVTVLGTLATFNRTLLLNGRHQANDSPNMVFVHRRIGLLPAVLHPSPRRALVIGLGGGATAGALSQYPGLTLDLIELSPSVIRGAEFFSHINFDVVHNPNVRMRVDDGRNFLMRVQRPYDVITADAIPPTLAGANTLNSVEYFRLVRAALAPDGVALHWNGGGTATAHKLILRAFVDVFPNATLWGDGSLMIGSREPMTLSQSRIEALLADSAARQMLSLMHVEQFDHLARMFRASPADIRQYLGGSPGLTDDKPLLEYDAAFQQEPLDLTRITRDARAVVRP